MNIAIDIRCLMDAQPTGVAEYTEQMLRHLFKYDTNNQYFLFYNASRDTSIPNFQASNITYCRFHLPNKLLNMWLAFQHKPNLDVLINKKYNTKIDLFIFPNLNFAKTTCPYIATCHDLSFSLFPEFFSHKSRLWHRLIKPKIFFQNATHVLAVSENTKKDLQTHYNIPADNITVVYPGLHNMYRQDYSYDPRKETLRKRYQLPTDFILFLGTIEPRKNVVGLVKAFSQFKENTGSHATLVIAGKKGYRFNAVKRAIRRSPYKNDIIHIGFIAAEDKPLLYAMAKVFLFPSYYEGFGFPPLEAQAVGTPAIVSHTSSLAETNLNAQTVNPYNIHDSAQAITEAMTTPIIPNREQIHQSFSWDTAGQQLETIIKHYGNKK